MLANKPRFRRQKGTSLLEVLIAVLVLSVGLIGALKMQSEAVRQNANSRYVSLAGIYAMEFMELAQRTTGITALEIASWKKKVKNGLPDGNVVFTNAINCTGTAKGTCGIKITWTPPGTAKKSGKTYAEEASYVLNR